MPGNHHFVARHGYDTGIMCIPQGAIHPANGCLLPTILAYLHVHYYWVDSKVSRFPLIIGPDGATGILDS